MPSRYEKTFQIASLWNGDPVQHRAQVEVKARIDETLVLMQVEAPFHNDPPPPSEPGSTEGLWNHEVVELFLAGHGERYLEIELGPFGHYLVLLFSAQRSRDGGPQPAEVWTQRDAQRWTGELRLDRAVLGFEPCRGNAFAIHGRGPQRQFMAAHPCDGPKPDFHQLHRLLPLDRV